MAYEIFDSKATRGGAPALTLTTDARISLNAFAGDIMRRAGMKFVHVLWDAETRKLALQPVARPDERSFKLSSFGGQKRGMAFSAKAFLRYIQWDTSNSFSAPVEWNEKERLLEASLAQGRFQTSDPAGKRRK